ncbi:hypothetical protein FRB94_008336 [Tulasnella sp. JGI-2019a]|nr:hypothetical protein FRB94_008336 [Tulasnella sp. JGI-2019a]
MATKVDGPHPATMLTDTLVLTFKHLSTPDLIRASLVCRLWSLLALNMHWSKDWVTLSQVVARLQGLNVTKEAQGQELGVVGKEAWITFNEHHAEKVQYLTLEVPLTQELCDLLKKFVSGTERPGLPFPKLYALSIASKAMNWSDDEELMDTVKFILTSPLLSFIIDHHESSQPLRVNAILKTLVDLAPQLRHLKAFQTSPRELIGNFPGGFGAFKQLTQLHVSEITYSAWKSLEGCPKLAEVMLQYSGMVWDGSVEMEDTTVLPTLHTLRIDNRCQTPTFPKAYIYPILLHTTMPSLRTIQLEITDSAPRFEMIIRRLQENSPLIEELTWWYDCDETTSKIEHLLPFARLVRLTLIPFGSPCGPLTNAHMEEISRKLPRLKELYYRPRGDGIIVALTDASLVTLARHSPLLEKVHLEMQLGNFTPDACVVDPHLSVRELSIRVLNLSEEAIPAFASFLTTIYPNVDASSFSVTVGHFDEADQRRTQTSLTDAFIKARRGGT